MKALIYFFYGYFLLAGGYRNFSEEIGMRSFIENLGVSNETIYVIRLIEILAVFVAFLVLAFPSKKGLHLLYFCLIFPVDFYLQNFVYPKMKYIIVIDFLPLLFFFYLHFKNTPNKLIAFNDWVIKLTCVGFMSSVASKELYFWLNPHHLAIYNLLDGFEFGNLLNISKIFLSIQNFYFYKACDYFIIAIQAFSAIVFFKTSFFRKYSLLLVLFHLLVLLFLGLFFFFPFLILYALILLTENGHFETVTMSNRYVKIVLFVFFVLFAVSGFDKFYLIKHLFITQFQLGLLAFFITLLLYCYFFFQADHQKLPEK